MIQDLLERRIPQVLGLYLGVSWGCIQFVQWLTSKYSLPADLDHIAFVTLVSLIPTVWILTWYHGRPKSDERWTRMEKLGIPVNLAVTAFLLFTVISGREVDATTRTVMLVDEQGQQIERKVPKSEFRQRFVVFGLANRSGDAELDWLEDGLSFALIYDLLQDSLCDVDVTLSGEMWSRLQQEGFDNGARAPLMLRKRLAEELHHQHFVSGSLTREGDGYRIDLQLFETESGRQVAEEHAAGTDLFALVDQLSIALRRSLGIPESHIESTEDLPISELLTPSLDAYRLLILAMIANRDGEHEAGISKLERAMELDSTFAIAELVAAVFCLSLNDEECSLRYFELAMKHRYKLPPAIEFQLKTNYYLATGDNEKYRQTIRLQTELFPDDLQARLKLATLHRNDERWLEALAEYEKVLEIARDPHVYFHTMGDLELRAGRPVEARRYYDRYLEQFPREALAYEKLGDFLVREGSYEEAHQSYDKAEVLSPDSFSLLRKIARLERDQGRFQAAEEGYLELLERFDRPQDRAAVYEELEDLARVRGQLRQALAWLDSRLTELAEFSTPLNIVLQRMMSSRLHALRGDREQALARIEEAEGQMSPPFDGFAPVAYALVYTELGEAAAAAEHLDRVPSATIDLLGMSSSLTLQRARIYELQERWQEALEVYRAAYAVDPLQRKVLIDIGRCHRQLGQLEEARQALEEAERYRAWDGHLHLEAALVDVARGRSQEAEEHLREALRLWSAADPEHAPAEQARAELEQLTAQHPEAR